jgi:hypothetical protein
MMDAQAAASSIRACTHSVTSAPRGLRHDARYGCGRHRWGRRRCRSRRAARCWCTLGLPGRGRSRRCGPHRSEGTSGSCTPHALSARTVRRLGERISLMNEAQSAVMPECCDAGGWRVSPGVVRRAPRPGDSSSSSRFLCLSRARAALRAPIIATLSIDR